MNLHLQPSLLFDYCFKFEVGYVKGSIPYFIVEDCYFDEAKMMIIVDLLFINFLKDKYLISCTISGEINESPLLFHYHQI